MKLAIDILEARISDAMERVAGSQGCAAIVRPASDPKFGDFQANGVMALAKKLKTNPRKLAEEVVAKLDIADICEPPEVAGPGFINLRLKGDFITASLLQINKDAGGLGIEKTNEPKTVVVDFSSPNIAKQMHVGHLRSTILGDAICRMLECLGHKVIRQNHIGDWGTQMGMVIYAIRNFGFKDISDDWMQRWLVEEDLNTAELIEAKMAERATGVYPDFAEAAGKSAAALRTLKLENLEGYYKNTTDLAQNDPEVGEDVRRWTVALQKGDGIATMFWRRAKETTLKACYDIYKHLGVDLTEQNERGESFYHDRLSSVVDDLRAKGLVVESDGAICVFPEGFRNKEGEPLPFIIQKSDGAYLYATTDLAALRYRVRELKADVIAYVTDARQKMHFEMLFAVARMAGWATDDIELTHVMFGSILGEDGTPLKTRSGENVKLKELLDEAVRRAGAVVEAKSPDLSAEKKKRIARAVGIGAVKYADYSNNRTSDYVFSFDKMLAMDGNTAPYMQYAYARIKSIERKAQTRDVDIETELANVTTLSLSEPAELDLAKHLVRYSEAVESAVADYRPNYLTTYLYELAQKFSVFYTNCPVLGAAADKRPTRLLLCDLTAGTIRHGLTRLLGIEVVEQM